MKYLAIVESAAKRQKIQTYLNKVKGHEFIVEASFGHIRYFENGLKSIDIDNGYKPTYAITKEKQKVVSKLRSLQKKVDDVVIATDIDREGEAIGFHLVDVLGLNPENTIRICFNEITQKALLEAWDTRRTLNHHFYNSQQTRSILDLLIGFKISPILWKNIKPKLSTGRCQSPSLKMLCEREQKISDFNSVKTFKITGMFNVLKHKCSTYYFKEVQDKSEAESILKEAINLTYTLTHSSDQNKIATTNSPPPYITSSIQQDASSNFGLSPKVTMKELQQLYEKGKITYMRTDSTFISKHFMGILETYINKHYPGEFKCKVQKNKKNAQEAHECIRPVDINEQLDDSFDNTKKKLFEMIRKRTIASQMKPYIDETYKYIFVSEGTLKHAFWMTQYKIIKLGWKRVYWVTEEDREDGSKFIDSVELKKYNPLEITALEKNSKPPARYTEASLVKELENKGIGRPSTFSSIVSKLFEREYATKETKHNYKDVNLIKLTVKPSKEVEESVKKTKSTSEKNKIFVSEIGKLVNSFMIEHFEQISSYDFTSAIESDLDKISNEEENWVDVIDKVYTSFNPKVVELSSSDEFKSKFKKAKTNQIGEYLGKNVYSYVGKFGPCIQYGDYNKETGEKPRYVSLSKDDYTDIANIPLDQAIELLKYPKDMGMHNGNPVLIKKGKYGMYIECNKKRVSIESGDITLEDCIAKLNEKSGNVIHDFGTIMVLNGKYGPYIKSEGKNYSVPPKYRKEEKLKALTKKAVIGIIDDIIEYRNSK